MQALTLYTRYARTAFAVLAFVCAASVFLYGTFLLLAVGHTASRANTADAVQELRGKLSSLEGQYLAATERLTPQYAAELGYVRPASIATVYAAAPTHALTLNTPALR